MRGPWGVCVVCGEAGRWMVGGNEGAMGCVCCVWRGRGGGW